MIKEQKKIFNIITEGRTQGVRPHLRYGDYKKGISKRRKLKHWEQKKDALLKKLKHGEQKKEKAVEKTETCGTEEGGAVEIRLEKSKQNRSNRKK